MFTYQNKFLIKQTKFSDKVPKNRVLKYLTRTYGRYRLFVLFPLEESMKAHVISIVQKSDKHNIWCANPFTSKTIKIT